MSAEAGTGSAQFSLKDCTAATCPYEHSFYLYRIDIVPNAVFVGLFGASLLGFVGVLAATRRGLPFAVAMVLGLLCEILGYAGRIMSWHNQWSEDGFLMQICCLTIGPAFLAAGIYLCIRQIVSAFGPENSRIPPQYYTRIFIPCDIISLVLQAAGGGLASSAFHQGEPTETGDHIMIAGLAFQVFTLLVFTALSLDYGLNTLRHRRRQRALDPSPGPAAAPAATAKRPLMFRLFPAALALSTVCILWRSVFRVAELSRGWTGPLMERQDLFVGFEGAMIAAAVLVLNVFHPSLCFGPDITDAAPFKMRPSAAKPDTPAASDSDAKDVEDRGDQR
ncbi:RTA1-domain-containing protein [Durotheca rogersii]|uniref:RTA1-domain-containing protein n=1 Tax=Durotheca rogersii TaxID=419775 RepID=UPI00221E8655|nr:RTA1-domain-containing protein [Durotheca rogersii]KAI5867837.1 RTA1-domain-containing protein [Durotheca rogersii]